MKHRATGADDRLVTLIVFQLQEGLILSIFGRVCLCVCRPIPLNIESGHIQNDFILNFIFRYRKDLRPQQSYNTSSANGLLTTNCKNTNIPVQLPNTTQIEYRQLYALCISRPLVSWEIILTSIRGSQWYHELTSQNIRLCSG